VSEFNGPALATIAIGAVFVYGGIKGKSPLQAVQAIVQGQSPTSVAQSQGITVPGAGVSSGDTSGQPGSANPGTRGDQGSNSGSAGDWQPIDAAMKSWGFSKAGRAGALGNLQQESGFNPNGPYGDNGTSHGIAQWHAGRLSALNSFCANHKPPLNPLSLEGQLPFMKHELDTSYADVYGVMRLASDPSQAAAYWGSRYEGFGDNSGPTRQANARAIYAELT
jgi:hypothetical protein